MLEAWPSSSEVNAAVAGRITRLLDEHGGPVADLAYRTLRADTGVLSEHAHSLASVLVSGACLCAGADWQVALWPAAGAECMMAAADLFDDVADADPGSELSDPPGIVLTAAAGILSLAGAAIARVVDDGASPTTAVALGHLFGVEFARAANGQAVNLQPNPRSAALHGVNQTSVDALTAYRQAAAKSGPLGGLIARLGARTATANAEIVELLGQFGQRLGVRSQLLNDARDSAPGASKIKADVRAGARTVPLAFASSTGAPLGLAEAELATWEVQERARIAAAGGMIAAHALAEAERLGAVRALDALERLGCPVAGLRELL
jgi:geranylgeranyl pyrophosphate synthase